MSKAQVNISDKAHFKSALAFSRKAGKEARRSLKRGVHILNCFKRNYGSDCILNISPDWVQYSFAWAIYKPTDNGNIRGYNGGLILHGYEETFSVELCPKNGPHWSIHT